MKLIRLKLDVPFRSLSAGFEVKFLAEWESQRSFDFNPYCLAGRNGSGKSNVLEALAAIFYHIECMYLEYRPDGFEYEASSSPGGFRAEKCKPDAFELEYFITNEGLAPVASSPQSHSRPIAHIRISKIVGERPEIHWMNREQFDDVPETLLSRAEVKAFLPKYVLGYSSGHNEILSLPFIKMRFIHFDEYRDLLMKDVPYNGKPEGRMIYLDDQFSQAILLCHFLFPSDAVTKVFEEKIGLKGIRRFRLVIRRYKHLDVAEERMSSLKSAEQAESVMPSARTTDSKPQVELTTKLSGLIEKFVKCSTTYYEDTEPYEDGRSADLYLDYWVNEATREAFQFHFRDESGGTAEQRNAASALNLFQSLRALLTLNYYQVSEQTKAELYRSDSLYLNETIPMPASDERIMRFKHFEITKDGVDGNLYGKSLSDGEHQLIHTVGLCLLFRHESALFLMDEPETHLNPGWRASYVSTLRAALEADEATKNVMREVLLTSHSPFVISDCRRRNVLIFSKDPETQRVTWEPPRFETFGASANAITIKVFGQIETIGDYAMQTITSLHQRLKGGESPDKLLKEAGSELGDSVEKVLFVNQALKRKEGN